MRMTDEKIRKGVSEPEGFRMNYTITYGPEGQVQKVEAEIRRTPADGPGTHTGYASYTVEPPRYTFQLTGSVTAGERHRLTDDFENTLKELTE